MAHNAVELKDRFSIGKVQRWSKLSQGCNQKCDFRMGFQVELNQPQPASIVSLINTTTNMHWVSFLFDLWMLDTMMIFLWSNFGSIVNRILIWMNCELKIEVWMSYSLVKMSEQEISVHLFPLFKFSLWIEILSFFGGDGFWFGCGTFFCFKFNSYNREGGFELWMSWTYQKMPTMSYEALSKWGKQLQIFM